jgi:glycosyltransferase involved in cell wall biosynthesis
MIPGPQVTVVIPHYNGGQFIKEAIRSVESQTFPDWEIVIVDDGSSEEHWRHLNALENWRIRILNHSHDGAGAATQRGIDAARGIYVAFLDQDDVWLPSKLQRAVSMLDAHPEIDLAFSGYRMINQVGHSLGPVHLPPRVRFCFRDLFVDYCIGPTATCVVRLSAALNAGPIDCSLKFYYDLDFFLRISRLRSDNVAATLEPLTKYRRYPGQLSASTAEMRTEWFRVLDSINKDHHVDANATALAQSNMHRFFAFLEYENERFRAGCKELAQAFRFAPSAALLDRRNWLVAGGCLGGLMLPRPIRLAAERFAGIHRSP